MGKEAWACAWAWTKVSVNDVRFRETDYLSVLATVAVAVAWTNCCTTQLHNDEYIYIYILIRALS